MTKMVCPCCGEIYAVGVDVQVGRKVLCGKCQHKHIFYNYSLVPFAVELSPRNDQRRIACPHCRQHFYIDSSNLGEYSCANCKALFYVSAKPEVFAPGVQLNVNIPVIPAATADPMKLPSEAFIGCATEPSLESPLNLPDDILPGGDVIRMPVGTGTVTARITDPVPPPVSESVQSAETVRFSDPVPFPADGSDVTGTGTDVPELSASEQARQIVKPEARRERSGFSGMLINLAEKICGK